MLMDFYFKIWNTSFEVGIKAPSCKQHACSLVLLMRRSLKQLILGDSALHADISVICYFNLEDVTYKN